MVHPVWCVDLGYPGAGRAEAVTSTSATDGASETFRRTPAPQCGPDAGQRAQVRVFVLHRPVTEWAPGEDVAYGLAFPDGSAFCIGWNGSGQSSFTACQSADNAALLHGCELVWLDRVSPS